MKNPYKILNISQNATKKEIKNAEMIALKERKYTMHEISNARIQLMNPAKRLIADFMFPSKLKTKRPKLIKVDVNIEKIDISSIDENAFNSLK